MGCGTSKAVQVLEEDPAKTPTTLEPADELTSIRSNTPDLDSKPVDPPTAPPIQSNGTESSGQPGGPPIEESLPQTPVEETPPQSAGGRAVAFEVGPAEPSESIIRRHPPKKFQKLEELQQDASNLTQEKLEEKQAIAERRRQEILTQRVQSAKNRSARSAGRMRTRPGDADEVEQQDDGIIESAATVNSENEL